MHVQLASPFLFDSISMILVCHLRKTAQKVHVMFLTHADHVVCSLWNYFVLSAHNKQHEFNQKNTLVSLRLVFFGCEDCRDLALKKEGEQSDFWRPMF